MGIPSRCIVKLGRETIQDQHPLLISCSSPAFTGSVGRTQDDGYVTR